jgi:hypothetical protein
VERLERRREYGRGHSVRQWGRTFRSAIRCRPSPFLRLRWQ